MNNWPKVKLGQVEDGSNIAKKIIHLAHMKSYMVIICPNSYEKLTKSEIRSSLSRFRTLLKITRLAKITSHIHVWPLLAPIHMKSWPNMKLGRYYLLQFGFIYPYLAQKYHFFPYLALLPYIYHFTHIWSNVTLITLIWSYCP